MIISHSQETIIVKNNYVLSNFYRWGSFLSAPEFKELFYQYESSRLDILINLNLIDENQTR
jgi:hypothetical protein